MDEIGMKNNFNLIYKYLFIYGIMKRLKEF